MDEKHNLLVDLYSQMTSSCPKEVRVQLLTIIIDIKKDYSLYRNVGNSLYLDVKRFIHNYLQVKRVKDYGYEDIKNELLVEYITKCGLDDKEEYRLLKYTRNLLKRMDYEYEWIIPYIKKSQLRILLKKKNVSTLIALSSWNVWTLIGSILLLFLIECILLSEAPYRWMAWFELSEKSYVENTHLNHICNVLSLHLPCVKNSASLIANGYGIFFLVVWYFLYLIIGANFLFKKLLLHFEIYDMD